MKLYKEYTPLVSVIIPTYNRLLLLKRAIDSVIEQTFKDWELIIVDDGSNDDTFNMVRKFQDRFENIKYIRHSNRKLPITMNTGITLSTGKYITFLGSDDEYKPEHLKLRIEYMQNNPGTDFIHGGVEIIGEPFVKDKHDLTKLIHIDDCVIGGTFFAKKEVFTTYGGFNNVYYSEDSDFFERIVSKVKITRVNFPTYVYYRDTPDSIASTIT